MQVPPSDTGGVRMPKVPLNLYLLKSTATPAKAVRGLEVGAAPDEPERSSSDPDGPLSVWLLDADQVQPGELADSRDTSTSVVIRVAAARDTWHQLVRSLVPDSGLDDARSSFGALIVQPRGGEIFLWSFGTAWSLIDMSHTVERFGLAAGLNALLSSPVPVASPGPPRPVGVRGLTAAVRAASVRRSTVATARPTKATSIERIDRASDAASMAELATHHPTFDHVWAGRSLRFEAEVNGLPDLEGYAAEALRLYHLPDYKSHDDYKWIDYTVPVGDRDEVDTVLNELYAQARSKNPPGIDVVWGDADPDSGLTPAFVCFPHEPSTGHSSQRTEISWASALQWLHGNRGLASGADALRTRLRFFSGDPSPRRLSEVELWELLVAQVSVGSDSYFVTDGGVWRASSSHITDVNNLLRPKVSVNPPWLPAYIGGEPEGKYNARAAQHGGHFLLDEKLVHVPGQSPFEPCDLLTANGDFLHVKRRTCSSTMSHAVAQALVSTQLLRSDAVARAKLDAVLAAASPKPKGLSRMRKHCASFDSTATGKVHVVLLGTWRGNPDITQLPLFTRINLNSWLSQMPCAAGVILVGT